IVMHAVPRRWAGAGVAGLVHVVHDLGAGLLAGRERPRVGRDIEHAPMPESAAWRIRIVDDQREALGARRRRAPAMRRRLVRTIAMCPPVRASCDSLAPGKS